MREPGQYGIEQRTRAVFDDSIEALDGSTRSRLTRARHAALAELRSRRLPLLSGWLPGGAMAAAAVLAVALWSGRDPAPVPAMASVMEDIELVAAEEELDMLGEDLEFYAWAAEQLAGGSG